MKSDGHFTSYGTFSVDSDRLVFGELRVAGTESDLYLRDNTFFNTFSLLENVITGTLHDLTKVTLIECITTAGPGTSQRNGESYHFSHVFPHFVIQGDRHLSPSERTVQAITIFVEDASTLFHDYDAFSTIFDAHPYISDLVKANKLGREVTIGQHPLIAYFTGKIEIFRVNTVLGVVAAHHNPSWGPGGPDGVRIDNAISVKITPCAPVSFFEAIDRVLPLLRLFEVLIGRPQNLKQLWFQVGDTPDSTERLRVYWSHAPGRGQPSEENRPHPGDVLTDPIRQPVEFSSVLERWLEMDAERKDARIRFSNSFGWGNKYSIDRLVGAANMFDILPNTSVPKDVELSQELLAAKAQCRQTFKALSASPERDSILIELKRMGKSGLKHKVRYRAKYVLDATGERFPELTLVLDEAINCRNHYVHGGKPQMDYSNNSDLLSFFVDSLEFVFAAAELIESGWNMQAWCEKGTTMSHPFGRYCVSYSAYLASFLAQIESRERVRGTGSESN